jgi:NTP pyrophosphatase (non-canonical NTP hydrolase)
MPRLLHAAMGCATEAGELVDAVKKHVFYGKELDTTNLIEELGDQLWYIFVAMDVLGVDFEGVARVNIEKLRKRYGAQFSESAAVDRDLIGERKVLTNGKTNRDDN